MRKKYFDQASEGTQAWSKGQEMAKSMGIEFAEISGMCTGDGCIINHGVPEPVKNNTPEIKRAFLRGLFDTDGSITFEKNYTCKIKTHKMPKISIGGVSKTLIDDCIKICIT